MIVPRRMIRNTVRTFWMKHPFVFGAGLAAVALVLTYALTIPTSSARVNFKRRHQIACQKLGNPPPAERLPPRFGSFTCAPKYHIGFLKTHRCGSSSVQNILFRFAMYHELFLVVPEVGEYVSSEPFRVEDVCFTASHRLGYHMLALHARWNHNEVRRILPADAVFISIVRDPVSQFTSMFHFLEMDRFISLDHFAAERPIAEQRMNGMFGRNQQLWDFGLDGASLTHEVSIRRHVAQVERQFDLVLVADRMDESLILLSELLCWPISYVVTLRLNAFRVTDALLPSNSTRRTLTQWLRGDYILYDHFYRRLEERVALYGVERMRAAVQELRRQTTDMVTSCMITRNSASDVIPQARWSSDRVYGYATQNYSSECQLLTFSEKHWVNMFREAQTHLANTKRRVKKVATKRNSSKNG